MSNSVPKRTPDMPVAGRSDGRMDWLWLTLPVALIAACSELGYAVLNGSVLPVYIQNGLGLDAEVYGLIMVPFFVSEALCKGALGALADRIGRKPLMVAGPFISIFTPLVFIIIRYHPYTTNPPAIVAYGFLRLLDGIGAAALWPAMFAYVGDVVREQKRAAAMGLLNVTYMLGLAFGFLAGGLVDDTFGPVLAGEATFKHQLARAVRRMRHHPRHIHDLFMKSPLNASSPIPAVQAHPPPYYHPSFYLASLLFGIAACVALLAIQSRRAPVAHAGGDHAEHPPLTWRAFVEAVKTVPGMMVVAFITFLGIGCIMLNVKKFAMDEFNISETTFGWLVVGPALAIGALAVPLGHLSDLWGKVRSVRLGLFLAAAGMWTIVGFYRNPHFAVAALIGAGALLGIGFVMAFPAWMALLTEVCREAQRGTVTGAVSMAQGVGALLGVVAGGVLYSHASRNPHVGHIAPFVASAVLLSVAVLVSYLVIRSLPRSGAAC